MNLTEILKMNEDWDPGDLSKGCLDGWGYFDLLEIAKRQTKLLKTIYEAPMDESKWIRKLEKLLAEMEGEK